MKKLTALLLTCLVALVAFNANAVDVSDFVIDEGMPAGDVNNDNKVNVSDVTTLVNMILGVVPKDMSRADIDSNGKINVSDVTALINIILGTTSGGGIGGSVIKMSEFSPISGSTSGENLHQWAEGDVIFIAVDPDYNSSEACKNVYAMVRTGGKWVLRDVNGNNKQGFKTVGGTLCAAYVQHADLENTYYNYIPLTGDVACVNRAANYTVTGKDGKFYITIRDIILDHFVSRIDVSGAYEGDYFYESVTHLDALTKITWQPLYAYGSFETSGRAPVIDIDSNHKGYAYGVWRKDTRANGWLTLNYAKNNGYSYYWTYNQTGLEQGRSLSINSPWTSTWGGRDLSMRYYNYDDRTSYRLNAGSTYQNVNINVGTNIVLRPYDGNTSDSYGTMTSVSSSNSGILDINSSNDQVSVVAHKVGTTTLTIKYKTRDNLNCTYVYEVKVNPTVWAVGATSDKKPILWRNWENKSMYLSGRDNYTSANEVIVRGSTAYVMMRKDVSNSNTDYYSGTAAILKATGAHGGGYFNVYKDGLTGASKIYCRFTKPNATRYIAGIPHMWVDKNNNVYYTTAHRENYTDEFNCIVSTDIYKNRSVLFCADSQIINDLVTDDSGNLYFAGIYSNFGNYDEVLGQPYIFLGDATGYFARLTTSNSCFVTDWNRYLLNRLFVKDGVVYVDAFGFYERDSNYNTYYWSFGKNVFLRYTASGGLQLYTGQVSENGLSMGGSNYNSSGTLINPGNFLLEGNKFYYSGGIRTYQLGASQTASYTAYPSGTSPILFDVKNGMIGMVLNNGSSSPLQVMASQLNTSKEGTPMENSTGATVYDVWLQTSLDE